MRSPHNDQSDSTVRADAVFRSHLNFEKTSSIGFRYPAKEDLAVHGSINDQRRRQTCRTKRREERRRLPVAVGHAGQQTLPLGRPPPRTSHVRLGPCFVDEDEPIRIQ